MAEQVTFTTAVDSPKTVFRVTVLALDWLNRRIDVRLRDWDGEIFGQRELSANYTGETATNLMIALNKANLTTTSLQKRVIQQLVTDGKLPAGSVTGTPD
jgi:hypothetical protein